MTTKSDELSSLYYYYKTLSQSERLLPKSSEKSVLQRRLAAQCWIAGNQDEEVRRLLESSGRIVDDPNGVNNYAGPTLALAERSKNESQKWECRLSLDDPDVSKWIKKSAKNGDDVAKSCNSLSRILMSKPLVDKRDEIVSDNVPAETKHFSKSAESGKFTFKASKFGAVRTSEQKTKNGNCNEYSNSNNNSDRRRMAMPPPQPFCQPASRFVPNEKPKIENECHQSNPFKTAHQQLIIDCQNRYGQSKSKRLGPFARSFSSSSTTSSSSVVGSFKPPLSSTSSNNNNNNNNGNHVESELELDSRYKGIDPKMIELITNEIMDHGTPVTWDDIAGLEFVKTTVKEIVVFPLLRPDIFTGLRGPPKGLLLFGPPGTGKTLIGKCIASQSKSTFFSISASSMTSKWVGEGEKMVRALFAVAKVHQPSVVFIDEIDSLLTARSDNEHESSRRLKTEFLVQLDGATTTGEERILIVGATNRPQDLDEAARRRLVKRLYVPLPEKQARIEIINNLLRNQAHELSQENIESVAEDSEGYSGADVANLCKEAAMGPIRSLDYSKIEELSTSDVRPIRKSDFDEALRQVKASVSQKDLLGYYEWDKQFGSGK